MSAVSLPGLAPEGTDPRFAGIGRLYGAEGLAKLQAAHVCVIGLGGVGSWTVEALARSGVGRLTLVDLDEVCVSNTNRQIHALAGTVGRAKAEVLAERVRAINPAAEVHVVLDFFTAKSAEAILASGYDVVVDAIDQFVNKCALIEACRARGQRLVVVGGAGGRVDPSRVRCADISKSEGDKLLQMIRKRLRQKRGFPRKGSWKMPCVFSDELPTLPPSCEVDGKVRGLDCESGYGAAVFVTGTFGFLAAGAAVRLVLGGKG